MSRRVILCGRLGGGAGARSGRKDWYPSRQICLTKRAAYGAKYFVEWRQLCHLVSQTDGPESFQPRLFLKDGRFEIFAWLAPKLEFLADRVRQMIQLDSLVGCQVPKIIEVARLVPRLID